MEVQVRLRHGADSRDVSGQITRIFHESGISEALSNESEGNYDGTGDVYVHVDANRSIKELRTATGLDVHAV